MRAEESAISHRQLPEPNNRQSISGLITGRYERRIQLDESKNFWVDWSVDYQGNRIDFAISIDTEHSSFSPGSDMFALGFSKDGRFEESDFCLVWYDLSHTVHLQDAKTDLNNRLEFLADESSSKCRLSNRLWLGDAERGRSRAHRDKTETQEMLTITLSRPLDICDDYDRGGRPDHMYYRIDNGTTNLVWFALPGPLLSIDGQNLTSLLSSGDERSTTPTEDRSASWGLKRVQLVSAERGPLYKRAQHQTLEIRMDKYEVPARETTYWCKLFKLPERFQSRRLHITKYEATIEAGNEHIVHHMELFNCAPKDDLEASQLDGLYESGGWQGECNAPDRPVGSQSCKRVILAWAMGARPLEYPEQVGQSIGGHKYNPYVVLEVHYNNQHKRAGLVDSSGLKFDYTHRLRRFDAGIIEVGLEYTDKNSIPAGLVAPLVGYCTSQCTRTAMAIEGVEGIHIFAGQLHTHLAGVSSWTELIREGRLLGELQRDDHYSPHFQEIRLFPEPIRVEPGDTLAHYCLYDTRKRTNITLGGYATSEEMCVTYLHYYPRIDLEVCKSSIETGALEAYFAYLARAENQPTSEQLLELVAAPKMDEPRPAEREATGSGDRASNRSQSRQAALGQEAKSVADNYRSIDWSERRSLELLELYARAPLSVQCNRSSGARLPGSWEAILAPKVTASELIRPPGARRPLAVPFWKAQPEGASGAQLAAYRGSGFGRRHAQCAPPKLQIVGPEDRR